MALFDIRDAGESLEDLLAREREAITSGRFDVLERLASEKERLVNRIAAGNRPARNAAPETSLERLKAMAERNQGLLDAMRAGLRSAQAKLDQLGRVPSALHTYDASGRKIPMRDQIQARDRRS